MTDRGRRKSGLEPIGMVLRTVSDLEVPSSIEASPVAFRDWEAAVGSRIAARARPVKIERGVLFVRAASATWAQELSLLGDTILEQLRARGLEVKSLHFRVGQVDPPERPPSRSEVRTEPPEAPLPRELREELARVEDDELRISIARAAGKNLGWQIAAGAGNKRGPADGRARAAGAAAEEGSSATSRRPAARGPRSVAPGSDRSARTPKPASGARRGKP